MIRVNNQKVIGRLSRKTLKANRFRNGMAVFAIMLTTLLFSALFTIAGTMVRTSEGETFRQAGGDMHGTFKDVTLEEKEILKKDPMIVKAGERLFLGMADGEAFRKVHGELSYMDDVCAEGSFCLPKQGRLPEEGTKEIACDSRILECLGITPRIGEPVTITYNVGNANKKQITDTFTLCGWWDYDFANTASMALLPKSYVNEIAEEYPREDESDFIGKWDLNIYLKSSMHIEEDMKQILASHGYQTENSKEENYIGIGVNWGYAGAQMAANIDAGMVFTIAVMLVLIILTGYLIIYNIFQISVSSDIHSYGLLKTIGATGRQIRRMIRRQVLLLSAVGIPFGIVFGYLAGRMLAPIAILSINDHRSVSIVTSPWIFIGAAVFSLITVLLSCRKPGRIAAKVSPVEAVSYTDVSVGKKQMKRGVSGGKTFRMAIANLGRNKKKTLLVVLSLSLAVVLFQGTYLFACGFDMDKYLEKFVISDFILGDATYFQVSRLFSGETALPEEEIERIQEGGEITESGRIYGLYSEAYDFVSEERYRGKYEGVMDEEVVEEMVEGAMKDSKGNFADEINLYGMEDFPLSQVKVIDGDLKDLYDPNQNAIAAVYQTDDYSHPIEGSNWAKTGDEVTIRYVYEWKYRNPDTGEKISEEKWETYDGEFIAEPVRFEDITYRVAACVMIKNPMTFRMFRNDDFVLNAEVFMRDSKTADVMAYMFNTTEESNGSMDDFLKNYTENISPLLDYESKEAYSSEFEGYRNMFLLMGGALSFVIGLVGVLNFLNAILTGIHSRRREFAILQSIGMTKRQLKQMLICEGLLYVGFTAALSLILSFAAGSALAKMIENLMWFFTYRFRVLPLLLVIPVFVLLGILLPLLSYRNVEKQSIVERLRESEQ